MNEFKKDKEKIYFTGMVVSILFSVMLSLFMWVVITVAGDFALKVNEQQQKIEELTLIADKYKSMYEEIYDRFMICLEYGGEACGRQRT